MREDRKEKTENTEFDVSKAMDDMRARVITGAIENFLSKVIPQKNKEISSNIHQMDEVTAKEVTTK